MQIDLDGAALERRSVISLPPEIYKKGTGWAPKKARKAALDRHSCRTTLASHTRRERQPYAMPPTPLRDNLNDMAARTTRAAEKARIDAARRKADEKVRASGARPTRGPRPSRRAGPSRRSAAGEMV